MPPRNAPGSLWARFRRPSPYHMMPAMFLFTMAFALFNPALMILMVTRGTRYAPQDAAKRSRHRGDAAFCAVC